MVQPELKPAQSGVVNSLMARGDFEVVFFGMTVGLVEPDAYLRANYHSTGSRNRGKWRDTRADSLIDRQREYLPWLNAKRPSRKQ